MQVSFLYDTTAPKSGFVVPKEVVSRCSRAFVEAIGDQIRPIRDLREQGSRAGTKADGSCGTFSVISVGSVVKDPQAAGRRHDSRRDASAPQG